MRRSLILFGIVACAAVAPTATADGFGLGVKAGTLGLGVEATVGLTGRLNLRAGFNSYTYHYDETAGDVRYDADLELRSTAAIVDWHPFAGTFRLSAGLLSNKNGANLTATPTSNQTIGGVVYTPSQIGTLNGTVSFKKTAPYLGLGFGNAAAKSKGLGFSTELGVLFQGKPDARLTSTGSVSQADLRAEEQKIENDLDSFKTYPVLGVGLSYQF